jgi:hypothetical protein
METPVKKKSSEPTTPLADAESKTPDAPIKMKLPMLESTPDSSSSVSRAIDFDKEETRAKHCGIFADRLSKFYIDAIILIETYENLLTEDDYDLSNMKQTNFICSIMRHIRGSGKEKIQDYSVLLTKYGNINVICERAVTLCHDNEEIINKSKKIKKYLPVITKLVKFCEFELRGIPTCLRTGREDYEDYSAADIPDDKYKQKYLKYKNKYLELKKSLNKK